MVTLGRVPPRFPPTQKRSLALFSVEAPLFFVAFNLVRSDGLSVPEIADQVG